MVFSTITANTSITAATSLTLLLLPLAEEEVEDPMRVRELAASCIGLVGVVDPLLVHLRAPTAATIAPATQHVHCCCCTSQLPRSLWPKQYLITSETPCLTTPSLRFFPATNVTILTKCELYSTATLYSSN